MKKKHFNCKMANGNFHLNLKHGVRKTRRKYQNLAKKIKYS
jgi:hypothetical protein